MIDNLQKEDLRKSVLQFLTNRQPTAHPVSAIRRTVAREVDFNPQPQEIEAALAVLKDKGLVAMETEPLGSTRYWRATGEGVLHVERGE